MKSVVSSVPTASRLLSLWLKVGVQSFGGGSTTLALIRRTAVEQQGWLTEAEFVRFWSLVQLAPGINLLALTVLIGRKVAGFQGMALALLGLLLPSVSITIALTAGYARVQHEVWVQSALRGIIPAVVGLGLVTAWQIAVPLLRRSQRAEGGSFGVSLLLLLGSALAARFAHLAVLVILLGSATISAAFTWYQHRRQSQHREHSTVP